MVTSKAAKQVSRTKHIANKFKFVNQHYSAGAFEPVAIAGADQIADIGATLRDHARHERCTSCEGKCLVAKRQMGLPPLHDESGSGLRVARVPHSNGATNVAFTDRSSQVTRTTSRSRSARCPRLTSLATHSRVVPNLGNLKPVKPQQGSFCLARRLARQQKGSLR